jgi:electron transport complex protein RnfD
MLEAAMPHKTALPPHIRSADSVAQRCWGQLIALAPLFIAACFTGHREILRILLICLVSAIAFEFLAMKLFQKKENLRNGETVLAAALFSLLLPRRCPSEIVIFGVFVAVVAGKELFGGTGSYLLQPLLLARVLLQLCFPKVMSEPMLLSGDGNVWVLAAVGLGGIIFLRQKHGYWTTPVLFMAVCFICEALFGGQAMPVAVINAVLFTAFFLLADPVTLPLTRRGTVLFSLGAALLSSRLNPGGFSIHSAGYAILLMNLCVPWLDLWLRPVPYKTKHTLKATYPE